MSVQDHTVRRIMPRHFAIIDMVLAGHKNVVIAETLGMRPESVNLILRSPLVQAELARRRREDSTPEMMRMDKDAVLGKARSILEQATEKASLKLVELVDSPDASIQLRAAEKILDRVFGKDKDTGAAVINITSEHVQLLSIALKESRDEVVKPNSDASEAPVNEQSNVREVSEAGQAAE